MIKKKNFSRHTKNNCKNMTERRARGGDWIKKETVSVILCSYNEGISGKMASLPESYLKYL